MKKPEKYFSVVYDIERPENKRYHELAEKKRQGTITQEEMKELEKRRRQSRVIEAFVNSLKRYGVRINWSVFVFPETHKKDVEELLKTYKAKFDMFDIHYDIYTLEYAPTSNITLEEKIILHMKLTIESVVRRIGKAKSKSEKKAYYNELKHLSELAKVFGIEDEIVSFAHHMLVKAKLPSPFRQKKLNELK